ncbi:lipocalin family protein, partial [Escherichia coli]
LDDEYKYALVSGPNREYLWILARTQTIPDNVKADYVRTAQKLGFNVNELLWVKQ